MMVTFPRLHWFAVVTAILVISVTGCGGGDSPSSPSPTPAPAPGPAPTPAPTPGVATLAALSFSPSSVASQGQPTGTVTLTSGAPAGGAIVAMSSSNVGLVQVPATVTVPAGMATVNFLASASTTPTQSSATITATFNGSSRSATVTVTPPTLEAVYSVTSPSRGSDACVLGPEVDIADCQLDASGSRGFIDRYTWTYWAVDGRPTGFSSTEPRSSLRNELRCALFDGARDQTDGQGNRYFPLTIELVIQDRLGVRSAPGRRTVRLYPNRFCGLSF